MEENNRKGTGIFYAVIGVATLVVAIVGATFAYFTAAATVDGNNNITGETATGANASVVVAKVQPTAEDIGKMVPLKDDLLETAVTKNCKDSNNYTACHIYSVTITNQGEAGADDLFVNTTLQLKTDAKNIHWQRMTSETVLGDGTPVTTHATASPLGTTERVSVGTPVTYYVLVWLHDTGAEGGQNLDDAMKSFTGAVAANIVSSTGAPLGEITATFTA